MSLFLLLHLLDKVFVGGENVVKERRHSKVAFVCVMVSIMELCCSFKEQRERVTRVSYVSLEESPYKVTPKHYRVASKHKCCYSKKKFEIRKIERRTSWK